MTWNRVFSEVKFAYVVQYFHNFYRNRWSHCFYKSSQLVLIPRQLNVIKTLPSYLFNVQFNVVPLTTSSLLNSGHSTGILCIYFSCKLTIWCNVTLWSIEWSKDSACINDFSNSYTSMLEISFGFFLFF